MVQREFDSLAHLGGDMRLFPFVQADLRLAFDAFLQNQGISIFFLPVLLIWICSFSLLWLDVAEFSSYTGARIGGMLTLLLTTVALELTLESRLPSVHYFTLPNLLFYQTIFLLAIGICLSVAYIHHYHRRSMEQAQAFDRTVRRVYPALAVLALIQQTP